MDRDAAAEYRRDGMRLVIAIGLAMLVFNSWVEIRYAFLGKTARAMVTQTHRYTERVKGGSRPMISVEYQFAESSGVQRVESENMPDGGSEPSLGEIINVQYCPGYSGVSRIAGHNNFMIISFLMFVFAAALVGVSIRQAFSKPRPQNGSGLFDSLA